MATKKVLDLRYDKRTIPLSMIDTQTDGGEFDKQELKTKSSYFLLNGLPEFSVNEQNGRFRLLAAEKEFFAAKLLGVKEVSARIYRFSNTHAEVFSCVEKLKNERLSVMEEAYLMQRLIEEYGFTQDTVGAFIGKSRPAVANTLRLLTLVPEVLGLIESGKLSSGHARTLVRVPKEQQYPFALEAIKREYSVREMERAVKAYLTPPEVLEQENAAKAAAKSAELKAFIERMRSVFRTKVSLIGNDKKGRIYIDYYSPEDLYRFEEFLDMIESYER